MSCPRCGKDNFKFKSVPNITIKVNQYNVIPEGTIQTEVCRGCGWKSVATYKGGKWKYETY